MSELSAPGEPLRRIALAQYEQWNGNPRRSGAASCACRGTDDIRRGLERRVAQIAREAAPSAATDRWLVDVIAAWAPLAVVFSPSPLEHRPRGVSGLLSVHAQEVLEKEYAHVLAASRTPGTAIQLLAGDVQQFDLQIGVAQAVGQFFERDGAFAPVGVATGSTAAAAGMPSTALPPVAVPQIEWLDAYRDMSLAMAEYLHRQVLGIDQLLSDAEAMHFSAQIARARRRARTQEAQAGA
jgi:hypothetical protein